MKKKILALVLVLVLSVAMMVPVFAESVAPAEACSWVSIDGPFYSYGGIDASGHIKYVTYYQFCATHRDYAYNVLYSQWEPHGTYCSACGYGAAK